MLALECEAKATVEWDHQAFAEAFRVAVQACPPESCGALLYPLQVLAGDVPLAAILGISATAQLQAIAGRRLVTTPPTPSVSGTPALQVGGKCQCYSSNWSAPTPKGLRQDEEEIANDDEVLEECPHRKHKEENTLNEPRKGAISKESDIVKAARWVYQKVQWDNFEQQGSHLFHLLPDGHINQPLECWGLGHDVQETSGSQKDLRTANWVSRASLKDLHFFQIVLPMESPKIMGLKGIHSIEAL